MDRRVVTYAGNEDGNLVELVDVWTQIPEQHPERDLGHLEIAATVGGEEPEPGHVWMRVLHSIVPDGYLVDPELTLDDWNAYLSNRPVIFGP